MAANAAFFSAAAFFCSFWDRFQDQKRNKYFFHIYQNSSNISMLLTSVLKNRSYSIARKSVTLLFNNSLSHSWEVYLPAWLLCLLQNWLFSSLVQEVSPFPSSHQLYTSASKQNHKYTQSTLNNFPSNIYSFFCQMKSLKNILQSYRNYKKNKNT